MRIQLSVVTLVLAALNVAPVGHAIEGHRDRTLVSQSTHAISRSGQTLSTTLCSQSLPSPPRRGAPDSRAPAGTRGPCEITAQPFTPVLPEPNPEFSGNTIAEHPTFWFYVPYANETVSSGKFLLEDRDGNLVYQTRVSLPTTPGFVSLSVPDTAIALTVNQTYRWNFILYCNEQENSEPNFVFHTGLIQRLNMADLNAQLESASFSDRLALYRTHALWYDAAAQLNELNAFSPEWRQLLEAMEMPSFAQEPIAGVVVPLE